MNSKNLSSVTLRLSGSCYQRKLFNIFIADSLDNTSKLIVASDVVISFESTATIDAIVLGKPVVVLNFEGNTIEPMFVGVTFWLLPKNRSYVSHIFSQVNERAIAPILSKCKIGREEFLGDIDYFEVSPSDTIFPKILEFVERRGLINSLQYRGAI